MSFTCGPWQFEHKEESIPRILCSGSPVTIALIDTRPEDFGKANGHLIAAAPDLYEACKESQKTFSYLSTQNLKIKHITEILEKAISKAEGK